MLIDERIGLCHCITQLAREIGGAIVVEQTRGGIGLRVAGPDRLQLCRQPPSLIGRGSWQWRCATTSATTSTVTGSSICYAGYGTTSICFPVAETETESASAITTTTSATPETASGSMTTFVRPPTTSDAAYPSSGSDDGGSESPQEVEEEANQGHLKHSGWRWFGWVKRGDEEAKR